MNIERIINDIEEADECEILEYDFDDCFKVMREMRDLLTEYVVDHGIRDSDDQESKLVPPDDQDCSIIGRAINLLDLAS